MAKKVIRGKVFSGDPQLLQDFADRLREVYGKGCAVSRPLPTSKGDYHLLVTIYSSEG